MYRGIKIAGRYISTNRRGKDLIFTKSGIGGGRFSPFLRKFGGRMIADIKDIENFNPESDPLFDYVNEVAEKFWGGYDPELGEVPSFAPMTFYQRYCSGLIDTSRLNKYEESEEVQGTLKAFGLDSARFWYLCLLIKDHVEGSTINAVKRSQTHREEIKNLVAELNELQPEIKPNYINVANNGELTLKVGKHPVRIKDGQTLTLINVALTEFLEKHDGYSDMFDSASVNVDDTTILSPIKQFFLFDKYLSWFLKPLEANAEIYASKDKRLLVSRMIYLLGISNDKRFDTEYCDSGDKLNFLKNYLSKCKDVEIPTHNRYYLV